MTSPATAALIREILEKISSEDLVEAHARMIQKVMPVGALICEVYSMLDPDKARDLYSSVIQTISAHSMRTAFALIMVEKEIKLTTEQLHYILAFLKESDERSVKMEERVSNLVKIFCGELKEKIR